MSYTNKYYRHKNTLLASKYFVAVCFSVLSMLLVNLLISVDTFAASISISLDSSTISVDATGFNTIGDFYSSNNSTISVTTDNESGYTLSILGNNGTNLTNGSYNLSSIESPVSEESFSDIYNTVYNN